MSCNSINISICACSFFEKPNDFVKVGDEIMVKSMGYDNRGRLNLSRKEALPKPKKEEKSKSSEEKK